ncbi:MAG: TetR/AcrR family transcriptional regulator [Erythrobacter sp.]|jgi:AcrR family transcriptional regulator|nr:TetR/AcrR family transcriptional regulator [Erythrobacter sp.]
MQQTKRTDTRAALLDAAQRLIAERGLGTVSVKDITSAAGARNPSAVHYHFGNVETLIKEVFRQRYEKIEAERIERLKQVDEADPALRRTALLEAALAPFLGCCFTEEGRFHVRFCIQFAADPRFDLDTLVAEIGMTSIATLRERLIECTPDLPPQLVERRLRQAFTISLVQAADFARRIEDGSPITAPELVDEVATTLSAFIAAPAR